MSKSKGNTVDPQELIDHYGADTARLFMMFASPPELSLEWADSGVEGAHRFLRRLWSFVYQHVQDGICTAYAGQQDLPEGLKNLRRQLHQTLQKVSDDYARRHAFNTAIAAVMELMNHYAKVTGDDALIRAVRQEVLQNVMLMLSPIVPHITHKLWYKLGFNQAIANTSWPIASKSALINLEINVTIQINSKVRGHLLVDSTSTKETIEKLAIDLPNIQKYLQNQTIKKIINIENKLINIVI
jgi:leucyl-tRNA synthetase